VLYGTKETPDVDLFLALLSPIICGFIVYFYVRFVICVKSKEIHSLNVKLRKLSNLVNKMGKDSKADELILQFLGTMQTDIKEIKADVTALKVEVGKLKVKSGFYGFLGGAIALVPSIIIYFIKVAA